MAGENQAETANEDTTGEDAEAQRMLAEAASRDGDTQQQPEGETAEDPEVERLKKALAKANKDSERNRKRLKEYEDAEKTEQQRLQERAETAERNATDLEIKLARADVAAEKGLTARQARRLQGSTREELGADADELLAEFPAPKSQAPPDLKQGVRGGHAPTVDEQIAKAEASGDFKAARSLKSQKLVESHQQQ